MCVDKVVWCLKDFICLFFFSYRAWSKMLNFSDDGAARPEKAAILWKWLMEHIKNKKKNSTSVSTFLFQYKASIYLSAMTSYN